MIVCNACIWWAACRWIVHTIVNDFADSAVGAGNSDAADTDGDLSAFDRRVTKTSNHTLSFSSSCVTLVSDTVLVSSHCWDEKQGEEGEESEDGPKNADVGSDSVAELSQRVRCSLLRLLFLILLLLDYLATVYSHGFLLASKQVVHLHRASSFLVLLLVIHLRNATEKLAEWAKGWVYNIERRLCNRMDLIDKLPGVVNLIFI